MLTKIPFSIATVTSIVSIVFFTGQQSSRIEELFRKAHLAETERKDTKDLIYEIHGKVTGIERDIQYIKDKSG